MPAQRLSRASRQGYALEVEGVRTGYASLAVPVALGGGQYSALSVTAPVAQVSVDRCLAALQATAGSVERGMARKTARKASYETVRPARGRKATVVRTAPAVS
ncbi:hypothetical protein GCM10010129_83870 [Streptomyces fumigatiscleroticus]|nr:hypothetical protein GCM10010129_83870 [Streptomyces fumigatiscleroticus]